MEVNKEREKAPCMSSHRIEEDAQSHMALSFCACHVELWTADMFVEKQKSKAAKAKRTNE